MMHSTRGSPSGLWPTAPIFAEARWSLDRLGLTVFDLLAPWLGETICLALDDTLARKRERDEFDGIPISHYQADKPLSRQYIWVEGVPSRVNYAAVGERLAYRVLFRDPKHGGGLIHLLGEGEYVRIGEEHPADGEGEPEAQMNA